jgi:hypothetical protein
LFILGPIQFSFREVSLGQCASLSLDVEPVCFLGICSYAYWYVWGEKEGMIAIILKSKTNKNYKNSKNQG